MKKVAVVYGGLSAERDVALMSGATVIDALKQAGYAVDVLDLVKKEELIPWLMSVKPDVVFPVLHGRMGEDGTLQGVLEYLNLPYTGSGVLGSSLAMDKLRSKEVFMAKQIPTAAFNVATSVDQAEQLKANIHYPVFVKPAQEGSSIGVSRVNTPEQLVVSVGKALQHDKEVIIEQFIDGAEFTVGIVDNMALPIITMKSPHEFYDYDAKYISDDTVYSFETGLSESLNQRIQEIALNAFAALGCSGWGRVDLMANKAGELFVLEVNTIPGMTSHSLVPMAADAMGWSLPELVSRIVESALKDL